jgi:hypothetical protein
MARAGLLFAIEYLSCSAAGGYARIVSEHKQRAGQQINKKRRAMEWTNDDVIRVTDCIPRKRGLPNVYERCANAHT